MMCVWGLPCQEPDSVPPGEYISGPGVGDAAWAAISPAEEGNSFLPSNGKISKLREPLLRLYLCCMDLLRIFAQCCQVTIVYKFSD